MLQRAVAAQLPLLARAVLPCASQASSALQAAAYSSKSQQQESSWGSRSSLWAAGAAAAGVAATTAVTGRSHTALADAAAVVQPPADPYVLPAATGHLPKSIVMYQYEVCPFCCKVKAFLDYNKLPYSTVEVNPITKGELSWSPAYRKVPVVKLDGEVVADSSAIISRLQAELDAQQQQQGRGGWRRGKQSAGSSSSAEEQQWRKWVDERFVKVMTANIYRTWDESWSTTSYMADQSSWNWAVRQGVRVAGALLMWQIGQRMPKKYNLQGDLREVLYSDANSFIAAVGSRQFLGGDKPNLADLAMYGVLSAIKGTDTYNDLILNSNIGQWLSRMAQAVGDSARVSHS